MSNQFSSQVSIFILGDLRCGLSSLWRRFLQVCFIPPAGRFHDSPLTNSSIPFGIASGGIRSTWPSRFSLRLKMMIWIGSQLCGGLNFFVYLLWNESSHLRSDVLSGQVWHPYRRTLAIAAWYTFSLTLFGIDRCFQKLPSCFILLVVFPIRTNLHVKHHHRAGHYCLGSRSCLLVPVAPQGTRCSQKETWSKILLLMYLFVGYIWL